MPAAEVSSTQRRRLRSVLRQLRTEVGFTQDHVAAEMDWSLSKVIRIETGAVSVSVNDVRALLNLYSIVDKARVAEIIELARVARQRPWWYAYRDHYSAGFLSYLDLEAGAAVLKFFQPAIIPGLLQTEDYARAAIYATAFAAQADDRIDIDVEVRLHRQRTIFDQPNPPQVTVVLDEAALRRSLGGPDIMRAQLNHLLQTRHRLSNVALRLLPFSVPVVAGTYGQFIILEFEDEEDQPAVYLEGVENATMLRAEHRISDPYVQLFDRLHAAALDEDGSIAFISALADELA
jgi:transcriptional regulator with XRE-family HTH domain